MKTKAKKVITNDFLSFSSVISRAIIENSSTQLSQRDLEFLLSNKNNNSFVSDHFEDLYFSDTDNKFIDIVRYNIDLLENPNKRAVALAALIRACIKKRPRGVFTFVGHRYDDGRLDIKKPIVDHFLENVAIFNNAVFDNGYQCEAYNNDIFSVKVAADLVYFDPPYFTPNSDNDYVRRYHFVEGLSRNWENIELQQHTTTKKFRSYDSPFARKDQAYLAFESLISIYKNSIIVISYSSNALPTKEEMIEIISKYKSTVDVHEIDHLYSFGNQNHKIGNNSNRVKEYLFIGS